MNFLRVNKALNPIGKKGLSEDLLNSLSNVFDLQKQRKGISINPVNIENKRGVQSKEKQTQSLSENQSKEIIKPVKNRGLSSGSKERSNINTTHTAKYVEKIDVNDSVILKNKLEEYETAIINKPVEHAYVISENGEVYTVVGDELEVHISALGRDKLKNSKVTHNHVDDLSNNSFSKEDFEAFVDLDLAELSGVDKKYRYSLKRGENYTKFEGNLYDLYKKAEGAIPPEKAETGGAENYYHYISENLSKMLGIIYERKKK